MPDKKLTDNEIIKALECLEANTNCCDCALYNKKECKGKCVFTNALDLITRSQIENETVKALNGRLVVLADRFRSELKTAKAEAYKEFADKANEIIDLIVDLMFDGNVSKCQLPSCHKPSSIACENEICIQENKEYWHSKLNNLLKETVGE